MGLENNCSDSFNAWTYSLDVNEYSHYFTITFTDMHIEGHVPIHLYTKIFCVSVRVDAVAVKLNECPGNIEHYWRFPMDMLSVLIWFNRSQLVIKCRLSLRRIVSACPGRRPRLLIVVVNWVSLAHWTARSGQSLLLSTSFTYKWMMKWTEPDIETCGTS